MRDVTSFWGKYRFLSNFWHAPVWGPFDKLYPTVEHAYQAAKTTDINEAKRIWNEPSPGKVKRIGRTLTLRPEWDSDFTFKLIIMEELVRRKFLYIDLKNQLNEIDGHIQEGNTWGDTFWGVDLNSGKGENWLGRILMRIRDENRTSRIH